MYGTSVYDAYWDDLMRKARNRATLIGQRTKITAVVNSPRAINYLGRKFEYIINFPEHVNFAPRCGEEGPNGKVCILPKSNHPPYQHLSRSLEKGFYVLWHYKSEYTRSPVMYVTSLMSCITLPKTEIERMGFTDAE